MSSDECERCGLIQEDYLFDFECINGETLCEECAEAVLDINEFFISL